MVEVLSFAPDIFRSYLQACGDVPEHVHSAIEPVFVIGGQHSLRGHIARLAQGDGRENVLAEIILSAKCQRPGEGCIHLSPLVEVAYQVISRHAKVVAVTADTLSHVGYGE